MPNLTSVPNEEFAAAELLILERIKNAEKVSFKFDGKLSTWHVINKVFLSLRDKSKSRAFARHLVGATLQLLYPKIEIPIESSRSFDAQGTVKGNFLIGDTAIYVTDFATFDAFDRFNQDIANGKRVLLLVPENRLASGRLNAEQICHNQIAVESVESFVSQSIEVKSTFDKDQLVLCVKELIDLYNERVDAVETDKSLMIELPSKLL